MPRHSTETLQAIQQVEEHEWFGTPTDVELTPKQEEIRQKLRLVHQFLNKKSETAKVVAMILKSEEMGVSSRVTAYKFIKWATKLYTDPVETDKKAKLFRYTEQQARLYDLAMEEIEKAKSANKPITELLETASRIAERKAKFERLGDAEIETPDFEKIERTKLEVKVILQSDYLRNPEIIDITPIEQ